MRKLCASLEDIAILTYLQLLRSEKIDNLRRTEDHIWNNLTCTIKSRNYTAPEVYFFDCSLRPMTTFRQIQAKVEEISKVYIKCCESPNGN